MRIILLLLMILGSTGLYLKFNLPDNNGKVTRWDMPTAYSDSNYQTQNAKKFAEKVYQCTNGELDIVIHGSGSLFKGHEIRRVVQTGQAAIGERLLSSHANENPLFAFDSIPFIATGFDQSNALWAAAKEPLKQVMDQEHLVLLYSVPWPPQGLYFKTAVTSKTDMQRSKFRAYNNATARIAELAGMVPIQIEAAELSQALALGVVESLISSGSTGYDRKVWEHLDYYYDLKAWLPRSYVFANKELFQALSQHNQDCVMSSAAYAEQTGTNRAQELTQWYVDQLAENGMKVSEAGPQLKAELREIGNVLTKEWTDAMGPAGEAILSDYRTRLASEQPTTLKLMIGELKE
ncbi:MAG: TRAP-type C4-dicarboxylate transport system substrate-binding protein [Phenylobacterium sp.]|jgi:TRAP-type C4-dicarboxylate transport system substrate-binding protein